MESLHLVRWGFMGGSFQGSHVQLMMVVIRGMVTDVGGVLWHRIGSSKYGITSREKLTTAGSPCSMTIQELWGWRLILGVMGSFGIYLVDGTYLFSVMTGYLSSRLPYIWLAHVASQREAAISRALPGILDLLVICTGAGLSFDAAINVMVNKSPANPLIDEFSQVLHHMRMGDSRQAALRRMSARCRQPDVRSVCATLIQADELGTSISSTLLLLAEQIRISQSHRAEARANQAPVKMLFPLIFFIFPSLLLVLFGPVFLGGSF